MSTTQDWQTRIGRQRDWLWRGWQVRYSFQIPSNQSTLNSTPIILIHGFGAAIEHWRKNIPVLAENYPVYALDLIGFGASRKVKTFYSTYLWAEQIYDFWRIFINQPVIIIGNSIGSLVAMTAAHLYPAMLKGIVMLSLPDVSLRQEMIPKPLQPVVRAIENIVACPLLIKILFKVFIRQPLIIRNWLKIAYADNQAITEELVKIISQPPQDLAADIAFNALFRSLSRPQFAPSAKEILPQLQIPILLIWGLQDRMVPAKLAKMYSNLNPLITLVELENVGHCPHDECPERFHQIFLAWLANS